MRRPRFAFACALCAALPIAAAGVAAAQHGAPERPSATQIEARAAAGSLADPAAQIAALASASLADQVQAQLRLARSPAQALPLLDEALAKGKVDAARVKPLLSLALLFHDIEAELVARPRLHALVAWRIQRGRELAQFFSKQKLVEGYLFSSGSVMVPPRNDPVKAGIDSMLALGGMAVPACRELCQFEKPIARAYGVLLLGQLNAAVGRPDIEPLLGDSTRVLYQNDCEYGETPISRLAKCAYDQYASVRLEAWSVSREIEAYASRLTHSHADATEICGFTTYHLREAVSTSATSWDVWWATAREPWSVSWKLHEDNLSRSQIDEAWRDYLRTRAAR